MGKNTQQITFSVTPEERLLIKQIAVRAVEMADEAGVDYPRLDADMDVTACHANGCPIDLRRLLAADDFNFSHDVFGIRRHLNRQTGKLENHFTPRFARGAQ